MNHDRSEYGSLVYEALKGGPRTQDELRIMTNLNDARVGRGIAELLLDEESIQSEVKSEDFEVVRVYSIVRFDEEEQQHAA